MYFLFDGKKIYYEVYGSGKPIVILNGLMMSTKSWLPFVDTLSEHNQLILVDFFDQGQSHYKEGEEEYTQDLQVEVVKALLDELKLTKANIMGVSYGSEVAMKFAIYHPDRIERLMLFNATAHTSTWLRDMGRGWNLIGDTLNGQAYYDIAIPVIYSSDFYQREEVWMRNREKALIPVFSDPVFQRRIKRLVLSAESHDCRDRLNEITCPTLVVTCMQDTLIPKVEQDYLASHIKNSKYVALLESGHCSMYEQPLLFTALILGFTNAKDTEYKI